LAIFNYRSIFQNKSNKPSSPWTLNKIILILCFYFIFILPLFKIYFRTSPFLYKYNDILFFLIVIGISFYRKNHYPLGFSRININYNIVVGILAGGLLLVILPLMDLSLELLNLTNHELLSKNPNNNIAYSFIFFSKQFLLILIIPLVEQIFFTGIVFQSLIKKLNPVIAVYITGLIYTIAGFKISLGAFGLSVITSLLFLLTGSLHASLIFHTCSALGNFILENIYPRIITILGFLY
jgi:membrane protease YdiL (CAAX protease family)